MLFGSKKLIGLDIGSSTIKLAELDVTNRSIGLRSFVMAPTPDQAVVGGDIANTQAVAETLQLLMEEVSTKRKNIAAGLWGSSVIVKRVTIPRMDERLIGEQIRWEAEQYIPFDINDVNLEYKILKNVRSDGDSTDLLLVAARQENVYKYAEVIETAGLNCSILDVSGFALANCFERNYGTNQGQVIALINVGAVVSNFVIVESGEVVFCRDIPTGGHAYTSEIQKALGVSIEEAEAMKISAASGEASPDEIGPALEAGHDIICEEFHGSFDFFINTTNSAAVSKVYVTGGGSKTPGFIDKLQAHIGISCEVFDPFHSVKINQKIFSPEYLEQVREFASVAVGLGMRVLGDES